MAGGRDLRPRSPRWLNFLICSCGIASICYFFWRVLTSESDGNDVAFGTTGLASRLIATAVLPALLCVTFLGRAARRLVEGSGQLPLPRVLHAPPAVEPLKATGPAARSRPSSRVSRSRDALRLPSPPKVAARS